jgi:GDP-L-fucose synthase
MDEAKIDNMPFVDVWGTGKPKREFLHVDDLADACFFLMLHYDSSEIINVGTGKDLTIRDLAMLIMDIVHYDGELKFNTDKPDGTPRKLLDTTKINQLGWTPKIELRQGIKKVYKAYKKAALVI